MSVELFKGIPLFFLQPGTETFETVRTETEVKGIMEKGHAHFIPQLEQVAGVEGRKGFGCRHHGCVEGRIIVAGLSDDEFFFPCFVPFLQSFIHMGVALVVASGAPGVPVHAGFHVGIAEQNGGTVPEAAAIEEVESEFAELLIVVGINIFRVHI